MLALRITIYLAGALCFTILAAATWRERDTTARRPRQQILLLRAFTGAAAAMCACALLVLLG